jgi:hypothetical protein
MRTLVCGRSHLRDRYDAISGKVSVVCHDIQTRAGSTEIIGAWRNLRMKLLAIVLPYLRFERTIYVFMVTSGADALSLCIE